MHQYIYMHLLCAKFLKIQSSMAQGLLNATTEDFWECVPATRGVFLSSCRKSSTDAVRYDHHMSVISIICQLSSSYVSHQHHMPITIIICQSSSSYFTYQHHMSVIIVICACARVSFPFHTCARAVACLCHTHWQRERERRETDRHTDTHTHTWEVLQTDGTRNNFLVQVLVHGEAAARRWHTDVDTRQRLWCMYTVIWPNTCTQ